MLFDSQLTHFVIGDVDSRLVLVGVQNRLHLEAASGTSATNQIDDRLKIDQRLASPVQTDEGK